MNTLLLLLALLSTPATPAATTRDWTDVPRDVYVDGGLDRSVQTLVSDSPRMFAFVCGDEVVIFDPLTKQVSRAAKADFAFAADRTSAKTPADLKSQPAGELVRPTPQVFLARAGDKSLAVVSHQSKAGVMTVGELWQTMPVWKAIADHYEPDEKTVERLRAVAEPVKLQVVMATWCGDSKRHVPRLIKAVERANNPNVTIEIVGVGPDFESPMDFVQQQSITNVPTVIVRRGEKEVGRYVETPAGTMVEGDVCDILDGTMKAHPGRVVRRTLLGKGTYALRDARGRHAGTEQFELYDNESGGLVVHSLITRGDTSIDSWTTVDADRKPGFAEVTWRRGDERTRTRFDGSAGNYAGHSRGSDGGIVDQTLAAPAAFGVVTPATLSAAWADGNERVYVAPEKGVGRFAAASETFSVEDRRPRRSATPPGAAAPHRIPKRVRFADGSERRLVQWKSAS
jgi:thiol-disulfide isomerase/thioredoxin